MDSGSYQKPENWVLGDLGSIIFFVQKELNVEINGFWAMSETWKRRPHPRLQNLLLMKRLIRKWIDSAPCQKPAKPGLGTQRSRTHILNKGIILELHVFWAMPESWNPKPRHPSLQNPSLNTDTDWEVNGFRAMSETWKSSSGPRFQNTFVDYQSTKRWF